ncbi:MAG TPA: DUF1194 domain-containing protein [Ferrovibrio sp.]|uniref:DUF1194 domain-containing protein n=1 Tax=Ferrovibrio sp. TaxID=1917215 RepID=UPI002B4B1986|nr:DUF1194 domain-containing protein [Ferrovibrio sp.]HLT78249.1 DUF1194 domain-containing protein [Ferrovibrio sp.]
MQRRSPVVSMLAWLAATLLLTGAAAAQRAAPERVANVDIELILAVDISGSIDPDEARLQRDGYARAIADPAVVKAIRSGVHGRIAVSYFEWADAMTQGSLVEWMLISDQASAEAVARRLLEHPIRTARRTSISGAIQYAIPIFGSGEYRGVRRVLDISGDGPNNDGPRVDLVRDQALAAGIVINGLPIMNGRVNTWGFPVLEDLDLYYEGCVIGGPGSFVVVAESFDTFFEAVRRKLILEIASAPHVPPAWQQGGPVIRTQSGSRYARGCDIGERQSNEFWRRRFDQ